MPRYILSMTLSEYFFEWFHHATTLFHHAWYSDALTIVDMYPVCDGYLLILSDGSVFVHPHNTMVEVERY